MVYECWDRGRRMVGAARCAGMRRCMCMACMGVRGMVERSGHLCG